MVVRAACETCAYFRTGTQFLPILTRQRDHARNQRAGRPGRAVRQAHPLRRNRTELTVMPQMRLDLGDAAEFAQMLTFLASWPSASQKTGPRPEPGRLRRPPRLQR